MESNVYSHWSLLSLRALFCAFHPFHLKVNSQRWSSPIKSNQLTCLRGRSGPTSTILYCSLIGNRHNTFRYGPTGGKGKLKIAFLTGIKMGFSHPDADVMWAQESFSQLFTKPLTLFSQFRHKIRSHGADSQLHQLPRSCPTVLIWRRNYTHKGVIKANNAHKRAYLRGHYPPSKQS